MGKDVDRAYVTDRLRALCSRREYCSSDILKKAVTMLDGNMDEARIVLEKLVDEKYVDDYRYSCAYARDKASIAGWGEVKIRYMLRAKGVASDVIDAAIEEIDDTKADMRLMKLMLNKFKSLRDDPQSRMKLVRYAVGRGYPYDEVISVADQIIKSYEGI